jgi:ferredoxin
MFCKYIRSRILFRCSQYTDQWWLIYIIHSQVTSVYTHLFPAFAFYRVNITFVNYAGERTRLPGKVGDSLYDVARRYKYDFVDGVCHGGGGPVDLMHKEGKWLEPKYGEGPVCSFCHVIIPKSHDHLLNQKRPEEAANLAKYPFQEDITEVCEYCMFKLTCVNFC